MSVSVLGPVIVDTDGALSPRERAILSALALQRGHVVRPDQLADAVWGERPPSTWPKQVQASVGLVRKVLGPAAIETSSVGYRLVLDADELDVYRFEELISRGRVLAATGEPDRAASTFARALGLWRGAPFGELHTWPPGISEAARLEEMRRSVEEDLLEARLECGEHREVAAAAEALVSDEPLRERRWAILALAQYRCGRQGDALRTLQRARRTLVEQLGIDPGRHLVVLETAILDQDESLVVDAALAPVSEECPYKGLAAYDVADHGSFCGRETQVAACLERLRTTPVLVVTGASGCGKSSLVRAGLAPALSRPDQPTVVFVPGADPLIALTDAMASSGDDATLIIDQFEELFAVGVPAEQVHGFCAAVAEYAGRGSPVIVAIRADHLTGLAVNPDLARLAERGLHFVTPLAGDELRAAIEEPARQAGLRVEHGLIDLLVRDAEGEPGALPLMSHALVETWRRRDGHVLTVEGYQASGGIRGAVARSADRLYDSLPAEQRPLLRSLMLRLVAPSLEGDPVRCRVATSTLRGDPARERIVGLLVRARLVTTEEDTVELAHEALARAWPRLRSWLDDDTAGQRILRHLAAAADGWESLGRPESELYRGARLETAIEYRHNAYPDLTAVESQFLDTSQREADSERDALATRARLDARRNRRLRVLLVATTLLLAVSLVAGLLAVRSVRQARDQRDAANAAEDTAQLESLVNRSLALRATDRDVASLLAVEAARRWPDDPRATSALLGTFTAARGFLGYRYVADADRIDGALVPGTSTAVIAPNGGRLALFDLTTGEIEARFPPPEGDSTGLETRVSADGQFVVQLRRHSGDGCFDLASLQETDGGGCAAFSVFEVSTGRLILGPITPPVGPGDVAVSDDGSHVAVVGGFNGDLVLYRTADGAQLASVTGPARPATATQVVDTAAVTFGPDGLVYVGSMAGPITIVDPADTGVVRTIDATPLSSNRHVSVGSDGIVVAAGDEALVAADVSTGAIRWTVDIRGTHPEPCPFFAASVAAGRLYCGNFFGVIEERDRATGQRTGVTLDPQLGAVGPLAITTDGEELVSFGAQAPAISRWSLDGRGLVTTQVAAGHIVADGYDFTGGSTLVVAERSANATIDSDFDDFALWDTTTDLEVDPLNFGADVEGVGWVGRDTLTGYVTDDQRIKWFDVTTRSTVDGVDIPVGENDPAQCERQLPAAGGMRSHCLMNNGDIWTIDPATRQRIEPTLHVDGVPWWVSATRGGAIVVVTAFRSDGSAATTVHDGRTGEQIGQPLLGPGVTSVSLDGVLVGATDGAITRYDLDSLQPLADLPGARGEINTLQFSDDGTILLATSLDQTVSVYDVATGTRLGDPIPMVAPFIYGAFLRYDGRAVAVTDREGVAIWDLDPRHLRDAACRLAGRNLTSTEWDTYLGDLGEHRPTCPQFV